MAALMKLITLRRHIMTYIDSVKKRIITAADYTLHFTIYVKNQKPTGSHPGRSGF